VISATSAPVAAVVTAAAATPMGIAHPAMVSRAAVRRRRRRTGEAEVDHPGSPPAVTAIEIRYAVMRRHYRVAPIGGKNYNAFSNQ